MKYDVVVIGGGSAGGVLAARLSDDPNLSVLLVEAGPNYPDVEQIPSNLRDGFNSVASVSPPHIWVYLATGTSQMAEPLPMIGGRVMGGSSSLNGQIFLRGMPEDYDHWADLGNDEWGFVKCLPYFRRLERDLDFSGDFHGSDGPIPVQRHKPETWTPLAEALFEAGLAAGYPHNADMNDPQSTGVGPLPINNLNGIRMSTAITHVIPIIHRSNLTIQADTLARRVIFKGKRAIGVELYRDGEQSVVYGDEIVLSAGAINSPQLLMLSGIGPAEDLDNLGIQVLHDLSGVGKNLMNHPAVPVGLCVNRGFPPDSDQPAFQMGIAYTAQGSKDRNDMFLIGKAHVGPPEGETRWGEEARFAGFSVFLNYIFGRGELSLISSDPDMQPRLDYHYLSDPWDLQRVRDGLRLAVDLLQHQAFKSLVIERLYPTGENLASDKALDEWILQHLISAYHSSGTCKMGPASDSMAVVDQYCKVHGLENLRVVDASVMPDLVRSNANCTTIMIAERVAEWMAGPKS